MSSESVLIKSSEIASVEEVGRELLESREIIEHRIGNRHWFLATVTEARSIVRRRSMWRIRRGRT